MRKVFIGGTLGLVASLALSGIGLAPAAQADTEGNPIFVKARYAYEYDVSDVAMNFSVLKTGTDTVAVTWNPGAFDSHLTGTVVTAHESPFECKIETYDRTTDLNTFTAFGQVYAFPYKTTTIANPGTSQRTDVLPVRPGASSYFNFNCSSNFDQVENGNTVTFQSSGYWNQPNRVSTKDVLPPIPSAKDLSISVSGGDLLLKIPMIVAGTAGVDTVQVRIYRDGKFDQDQTSKVSTQLSGADLYQRVGLLTNGNYEISTRLHNAVGWSDWSAHSNAVKFSAGSAPISKPQPSTHAPRLTRVKVTGSTLSVKWSASGLVFTKATVTHGSKKLYNKSLKSNARTLTVKKLPRGTNKVTLIFRFKDGSTYMLQQTVKRK